MGELLYESMTQHQAADALDEFLAERPRALQRLRRAMAAHGVSPQVILDSSLDSIGPVWEWITGRITELGVDPRALERDPTRASWPSWARHGTLGDPHPPAEALGLVDGFTSYLAQVVTAAVPEAHWLVGRTASTTTRCATTRCSPPMATRSSCPGSRSTAPISPPTAATR